MAAKSKGKKFEDIFRGDWEESTQSFCYRLYDVTTGYAGQSTPCDFICYKYPLIYLMECKSHAKNTLPFTDFPQYERLLPFKDIKGLVAGSVIWFYDHDKVVWVPIQTWEKIKKEDGKSFNIKMLDDPDYECWEIPSVKKRIYMASEYKTFTEHYEGLNGYTEHR